MRGGEISSPFCKWISHNLPFYEALFGSNTSQYIFNLRPRGAQNGGGGGDFMRKFPQEALFIIFLLFYYLYLHSRGHHVILPSCWIALDPWKEKNCLTPNWQSNKLFKIFFQKINYILLSMMTVSKRMLRKRKRKKEKKKKKKGRIKRRKKQK